MFYNENQNCLVRSEMEIQEWMQQPWIQLSGNNKSHYVIVFIKVQKFLSWVCSLKCIAIPGIFKMNCKIARSRYDSNLTWAVASRIALVSGLKDSALGTLHSTDRSSATSVFSLVMACSLLRIFPNVYSWASDLIIIVSSTVEIYKSNRLLLMLWVLILTASNIRFEFSFASRNLSRFKGWGDDGYWIDQLLLPVHHCREFSASTSKFSPVSHKWNYGKNSDL